MMNISIFLPFEQAPVSLIEKYKGNIPNQVIEVWEDGYLMTLQYRKHEVHVVAKNFKFFLGDIEDEYFLTKALHWSLYPEAVVKYGQPTSTECFGYVPLLGLGGSENVDNLQKVNIIEHIDVITQFMGPLE